MAEIKKTCAACSEEKPLVDFYKHPSGLFGRLHRCKECHKAAVRRNRLENAEYYKAYDRARAWLPERVLARQRNQTRRAKDRDLREIDNTHRREWAARHAVQRQANIAVGNAIRDGRLVPGPCERCGSEEHIHAHHEDYTKPLHVTWLCRTCHGLRHREINEERRQKDAA